MKSELALTIVIEYSLEFKLTIKLLLGMDICIFLMIQVVEKIRIMLKFPFKLKG